MYLWHIYFTILTMHDSSCCSKYNNVKSTHTAHDDNAVFCNRKIWHLWRRGSLWNAIILLSISDMTLEASGQFFAIIKKDSRTASFCIINSAVCVVSYRLSLILNTKWICDKLWGWVALPMRSFITMKHYFVSDSLVCRKYAVLSGTICHTVYMSHWILMNNMI